MNLREKLLEALYDSFIGLDYYYMPKVNTEINKAISRNEMPNVEKCAEASVDYFLSHVYDDAIIYNISCTCNDMIENVLSDKEINDAVNYLEMRGYDINDIRYGQIPWAIFEMYIEDKNFVDELIDMLLETVEKVTKIYIDRKLN